MLRQAEPRRHNRLFSVIAEGLTRIGLWGLRLLLTELIEFRFLCPRCPARSRSVQFVTVYTADKTR